MKLEHCLNRPTQAYSKIAPGRATPGVKTSPEENDPQLGGKLQGVLRNTGGGDGPGHILYCSTMRHHASGSVRARRDCSRDYSTEAATLETAFVPGR